MGDVTKKEVEQEVLSKTAGGGPRMGTHTLGREGEA